MEIVEDKKTGIKRHIYGTVNPLLCRKCILDSGLAEKCTVNGKKTDLSSETDKSDNVIFDIRFRGKMFTVMSRETLVDIIGTDGRMMLKLYDALGGKNWEYDNLGNRMDYLTQADRRESW